MYLERAVREEMSNLSKEVFGASGHWQKILKNGHSETLMRTVKEQVPGVDGAEPTFIEQQVPVLSNSGGKQSVMKYYTFESLHALMLDMKAQRDAFIAEYKRKQEEAAAAKAQAELSKAVSEKLTGSAL